MNEKSVWMTGENQSQRSPISVGMFLLVSSMLVLNACSSQPKGHATVEDQSHGKVGPPVVVESKPLPSLGGANAGKSGYYVVKPGDTTMQVGRNTGQSWRDIVRWNHLDNANQIEVGQVLRVASPESTVEATPIIPGTTRATTTLILPPIKPGHAVDLMWPGSGTVIAGYDGVKNKGLKIAGKLGDSVVASADGRVVFAGSSLRGYGNMIILKHGEDYLTAYAHNQTLLVKENQTIRQGQKIATMGSSDTDKVVLYFEVRHKGKPVNPVTYLPRR